MSFLGLCSDPLVTTLREAFGANIVRVPEERIQPLCVIASKDGHSVFRGSLAPLVRGEPALDFDSSNVITSKMSDVSGKRSRKVELDLGLQIMEGFLQGFGISTAGISAKLQGASQVAFAFKNVQRTYVDSNSLGRLLTGRVFDRYNPAAEIFFGDHRFSLLVIDSIITSSDFSISVERARSQSFKLDIPAIQMLVSQAGVGVDVTSSSGLDLIFQGTKFLSFAFSCVQLYLDAAGTITSMPPGFDVVLDDRNILPSMSGLELSYSPERVLLSDEPGLLSWDT